MNMISEDKIAILRSIYNHDNGGDLLDHDDGHDGVYRQRKMDKSTLGRIW